jgi:ribonucleotide monophosphatase NagD (HAD superfamily)
MPCAKLNCFRPFQRLLVGTLLCWLLPSTSCFLHHSSKSFVKFRNFSPLFMAEPSADEKASVENASDQGTTISSASGMKMVSGLRDIVDDYDSFLLDMWGVMHDGFNAYDGVIEAVKKLRELGKTLIVLSNSSQRKDKSIKNLQGLGFDPIKDFEQIITSGEISFLLLSGASEDELGGCKPWELLSTIRSDNENCGLPLQVLVLGSAKERDEPYVESCGWVMESAENADLILAAGTFTINDGKTEINKRNDPEAYETALKKSLEQAAKRGVPMLVSNPDKIRPDFERPPMPGRLGDLYEEELKNQEFSEAMAEFLVKRVGKPFGEVYGIALTSTVDVSEDLSFTGKVDLSRACMVGDALETDITGGSEAGIDTVWVVKDGVYMPEFEESEADGKTLMEAATAVLEDFNRNKEDTYAKGKPDQLPTMLMPHFRW